MKPNWLVVSALSLLSLLALISVTNQSIKYFGSNPSSLQASPSSFTLFNTLFGTSVATTSTTTTITIPAVVTATSSPTFFLSATSGPLYFPNLSIISNSDFRFSKPVSSYSIRFGGSLMKYLTISPDKKSISLLKVPTLLTPDCAFNNNPPCTDPNLWNNVIPGNTYNIQVFDGTSALSDPIPFIVSNNITPTITSLSPSSGPVGTLVTVTGSGFYPLPVGDGDTVNFGNGMVSWINYSGVSDQIKIISPTKLTFIVPPKITPACWFNVPPCRPFIVGKPYTVENTKNLPNVTVNTYNVSVTNSKYPVANTLPFTVTPNLSISPVPQTPGNLLGLNATTTSDTNEEQLVWRSMVGYSGYVVYINSEFLATTTSTYFVFPANALMPDSTYTFTVSATNNLVTPPATIALSKSWWQYLLAQVGGAGDPQSTVSQATQPAPAPINGNIRVLGIVVNMAGTDGKLNGPGAVPSPETSGDVSSKLFSSTFSTKTVYSNQSNGKAQIGGNVIYITIPYDSNYADPSHILIASAVNTVTTMAYIKAAIQDPFGYSYPSQYNVVIYIWPTINSNTNGLTVTGVSDPNTVVFGAKIYINGIQNVSTYSHEIGHVLGLVHGDKLLNFSCLVSAQGCTKTDVEEYGDGLSIMGNKAINKFIAHDKAVLGWIPYQSVTKSGPYTIDDSSAFNLPKKDSGDKYYIENYCGVQDICDSNWGLRVRIEKGSSKGALYGREMFLTAIPLSSGSYYEDIGNNLRVIDIKSDINSDKSLTSNVFVRFDATTTVTATPTSPTSVKVSWNYPDSVKPTGGYEIYRDSTSTDPIATTTATVFTDNVKSSACHTYYIRAWDAFKEIPGTKFFIKPFGSSNQTPAGDAFNTENYDASGMHRGQSFLLGNCPGAPILDTSTVKIKSVTFGYPTSSPTGKADVAYIYDFIPTLTNLNNNGVGALTTSEQGADGNSFGTGSYTRTFGFNDFPIKRGKTYYFLFKTNQDFRFDTNTVGGGAYNGGQAISSVLGLTTRDAQFRLETE